jgi:EVE domain
MSTKHPRAWLGVICSTHVRRGVAGGFAQLCHGRAAPLKKMRSGDYLIYYSPGLEMGESDLRSFTALGRVLDEEVFEHDMGGGFVPCRRRVEYLPVQRVTLASLKDSLELCARPSWGMALRRGHLPLSTHDFALIAGAMGVRPQLTAA